MLMQQFKRSKTAFLTITVTIAASLAATASAATVKGKYFDRAIIVIFENTNYAAAMNQPFFKQLADQGANFTQFMALAHPSQGNYIALTSGALNGVHNDANHNVDSRNIVDLLEAKNITWKVYAESYPGNCFTGSSSGTYVRKHNPFISYVDIQNDPVRCAKIVNADEFDRDAAAGTLPEYVFYVPDLKNDAHDTGVAYGDNWYKRKFGPYVSNAGFMNNTILISTFDESGVSLKNQIYTSIVGPAVLAKSVDDLLTIPSILKLIEENWGLDDLGSGDASAAPIPNIWK